MLEELLERMALALDRQGIAYMLIGGQAVLLYGEPRLTRDIDVTLGVGPDRVADVLTVAHEAGLVPLVGDVYAFARQTLVLPCEDPGTGIRVDFIFSFSPYEREALSRVRLVSMKTASVRFASPEDLIVHKVLAGRPRDLEDVRNVLLKQRVLDVSYIRRWLKEFEETLSETLLARFERLWNETR